MDQEFKAIDHIKEIN